MNKQPSPYGNKRSDYTFFIDGEGVERGKGSLLLLGEDSDHKGGKTNRGRRHQDVEGKDKPLYERSSGISLVQSPCQVNQLHVDLIIVDFGIQDHRACQILSETPVR